MRAGARTDSLLAALRRKGLLDEYCSHFFLGRPSPPERQGWLAERGLDTSLSSIWRMHKTLEFRSLIAAMDADSYGKGLPEDLDERTRRHLKQARYEHSLGELSLEETSALSGFYAEQDKLRFARQKLAVQARLKRRDQSLQIRKLKGKIEAALEALSEEIGGNERAQKHFDAMRAALKEARA